MVEFLDLLAVSAVAGYLIAFWLVRFPARFGFLAVTATLAATAVSSALKASSVASGFAVFTFALLICAILHAIVEMARQSPRTPQRPA
ncbi:MAG TPA: hypothetical protein VIB49_10290 [Thermoplasmata archaeon]|jgi:hypothetical protein